MTDQISTPGSNAESSVNAGKIGASKDKSCPFCQQPFTSSSLGRHLDLYIRGKNPKPPDGVHTVDEIRKMRGGITRRQPRNSLSRREGSTPGGTPGVNGDANGRRTPQSDAGLRTDRNNDLKSPTIRRPPTDLNAEPGKPIHTSWHKASWEATGVMNDIPLITPNEDSEKWDREGDDRRADRRTLDVRRTVSRQILAKNAFDQKQKMTEALDQARAAELALREVLGSIRAANRRVNPSASPFDYDPLSLDFQALTLHCLQPPPALFQVTPVSSPGSWTIAPPNDSHREALRSHFREAFHAWRITRAVTSSAHPDEILFYRTDVSRSSDEETEINNAAQELEDKILKHLDAAFLQWTSLSTSVKDQVWRLELARSVGRKALTITSLNSDMEKVLQENAHLRTQVEQLSRCQQPREFQMMPPTTIPISSRAAVELDDMAVRGASVGFSIKDKDEPIEGIVKNAVGRWLAVVQSSRGNAGMASQRPLDQQTEKDPHQQTISQIQNENSSSATRITESERDSDMDLDADADADADGEEHYDIPTAVPMPGRAPEAPMGLMSTGYRNHNGTNGDTSLNGEGLNGQYCGTRILL